MAGAYSLSDFTMAAPPAPSPPPHVHEDAHECVYVLEGTLEMSVGEDKLTGGPGSLMLAPRGTLHSLANAGPGPARFIMALSPPGFEGFWREMADPRARIGGPPDPETVVALQHTYHMSTGGEARRFRTAQARVARLARDANEPADRLLRVGDVDQHRSCGSESRSPAR